MLLGYWTPSRLGHQILLDLSHKRIGHLLRRIIYRVDRKTVGIGRRHPTRLVIGDPTVAFQDLNDGPQAVVSGLETTTKGNEDDLPAPLFDFCLNPTGFEGPAHAASDTAAASF